MKTTPLPRQRGSLSTLALSPRSGGLTGAFAWLSRSKSNNDTHSARRQSGLSLVELMIAMVLGLVLIGGVVKIYLASNATSRVQRATAQVQESGRYAFTFMGPAIREAGFRGCNRVGPVSNIMAVSKGLGGSYPYGNFLFGIHGYDTSIGGSNWSPTLDASISGLSSHPPVNGSDVLTVRGPVGNQMRLKDLITATDTSMKVTWSGKPAFDATGKTIDIAMISNCNKSHIFRVTAFNATKGEIGFGTGAISKGPANNAAPATKPLAYYVGASIDKIRTVSYFVASRSGAANCDDHDCSLYRKVGEGNAQELVSGVQNMQILYGYDNPTVDSIPDKYVTADTLGNNKSNWNQVLSARIALLITSGSDAANGKAATRSYDLLDQTTPNITDRKLRQVFTQTFTLRNRAGIE